MQMQTDVRRNEVVATQLTLGGSLALFFLGLVPFVPMPTGRYLAFLPYNLLIVLPGFFAGPIGAFAMPVLFFFLARSIAEAKNPFPKKSAVAFLLFAALSCVWAVYGWGATAKYYSRAAATVLILQSVVPPLLIALGGVATKKNLAANRSIVLSWCVFAWLAWSAFPWYGERL